MSREENVQIVKDFLQQWAATCNVCWRCPTNVTGAGVRNRYHETLRKIYA